jgi:excisionase family DNA binding protein
MLNSTRSEGTMTLIDKLKTIDRALTVPELAKLLHLGKTAIYDMVRRGAIPCIRFGYSVRFDPQEIAEWLQKRRMPVRVNSEKATQNARHDQSIESR